MMFFTNTAHNQIQHKPLATFATSATWGQYVNKIRVWSFSLNLRHVATLATRGWFRAMITASCRNVAEVAGVAVHILKSAHSIKQTQENTNNRFGGIAYGL